MSLKRDVFRMSNQDTDAPWRDEELLRQKYWEEGKSTVEIADDFGCVDGTVSKWMKRLGIERRGVDGYAKDAPWKDKDTLERLYIEEGLGTVEIGEKFGVSQQPIVTWLDKFDIETRGAGGADPGADYRKEPVLREMYYEKEMSLNEIASELECSRYAVQLWMEKHGLERRASNMDKLPYFGFHEGYAEMSTWDSKLGQAKIRVHRLIAVSHGKLTASEFIQGDKHVHHKNGVPWDNRPANLEVMTNSEHRKEHNKDAERNGKGQYT